MRIPWFVAASFTFLHGALSPLAGVAGQTAPPPGTDGSARETESLTREDRAPVSPQARRLIDAAEERLSHRVAYSPRYISIDYPNGDVPDSVGVCTDVVIRSFRSGLGIDLQKEVHEEMKEHFSEYPSARIWGLTGPDPNIDHRRVPNLQRFLERMGASLPVSEQTADYLPGDIVTWNLNDGGFLPHIGIVSDSMGRSGAFEVIHNIGSGPVQQDMLRMYEVTGHYRWFGSE